MINNYNCVRSRKLALYQFAVSDRRKSQLSMRTGSMHVLPIMTASDPGPDILIFARDLSTPRVWDCNNSRSWQQGDRV